MAFSCVGIELIFKGHGIEEKAFIATCKNPKYQLEIGKEILSIDSKYFRPTEVDLLIGDSTKAKTKLGWKLKYDLPALVKDMMNEDLNLIKKEQYLEKHYKTPDYFK
jgi:GDPmannose 4,6-dehydratase